MKQPELSVLMSVYNGEKYLKETIESILSQTFSNFEFIIIDDASTDSSRQIIKNFTDSRIKLIKNALNIGLTKSLNKGIKIAKGKYIARQDCGDLSLPCRLEKQKEDINEKKAFLSATGTINIFNGSNIYYRYIPPVDEKILKREILKKNQLVHSSIMFRNISGIHYREKFYYAQDYDLYLRFLSEGRKLSILSECLVKYRIAQNAISFERRAQQLLFKQKAQQFFHERVSNRKDGYASFDASQILSIDANHTDNVELIREQISAYFSTGDAKRLRKLYGKYIRTVKFDKYLLLYIFSFFPYKLILYLNTISIKLKNM